ncbi:M1 family metallopeptidase [bacterium]|nr:M1 family metallopeptidase [bacterium]
MNLKIYTILSFSLAFNSAFAEMKYPKERQADITHIKIEVEPSFTENFLTGKTTLTLQKFIHFPETLYLDAETMDFSEVKVANQIATFSKTQKQVAIEIPQNLQNQNSLTIEISYSATPDRGIFWVLPDSVMAEKPTILWTQGEDENNHFWFPCFDYPNEKATTELILTIPQKFKAVSNGILLSKTDKNGKSIYHFSQKQPHVSYLVSFVAGEIEKFSDGEFKGKDIEYWSQKDLRTKLKGIFTKTKKILKLFENLTGTDYPFDKLSQNIVPDFIAGGMENTSAITYTDEIAEFDSLDAELLIAHEIAHQWFGNLVTCKDWGNSWLNEGFATYFEYLYLENEYGKDFADYYQFGQAQTYFGEDLDYRRPIFTRDYDEIDLLFDAHSYEKGSLVIQVLRNILGDEDFFTSIKYFLQKHKFQAVETNDLKIAIEETTGKNLDWFFEDWVYSAGFPEFKVSYKWNKNTKNLSLTVLQTQKLENKTPVFRVPVQVLVDLGNEQKIFVLDIGSQEKTFVFQVPKQPETVIFDVGQQTLKKLDFDQSKDELIYQLKNANQSADRSLAAQKLSKFSSEKMVCEILLEQFETEISSGTRFFIAKSLENSVFKDKKIKELFEKEPFEDVKIQLLENLKNYKTQENIDFCKDLSLNHPNVKVKVQALRTFFEFEQENCTDFLFSQLSKESPKERLARTIFNLFEEVKTDSIFNFCFEQVDYSSKNSSRFRSAALKTLVSFYGDESKKEKISGKVQSLLEDPNFYVKQDAIEFCGELKIAEATEKLEFLASEGIDSTIRSAAKNSLKKLRGETLKENEIEVFREEILELKARIEKLEGKK